MDAIGNRLLSDYFHEEMFGLAHAVGFKIVKISPLDANITLGGNPARQIIYTDSRVKNGIEVGTKENMEQGL
jgi:hypothetical protein